MTCGGARCIRIQLFTRKSRSIGYISETRYNTVAFDIILFFFFAEGKVIILKLDTVHPEITYKKI